MSEFQNGLNSNFQAQDDNQLMANENINQQYQPSNNNINQPYMNNENIFIQNNPNVNNQHFDVPYTNNNNAGYNQNINLNSAYYNAQMTYQSQYTQNNNNYFKFFCISYITCVICVSLTYFGIYLLFATSDNYI